MSNRSRRQWDGQKQSVYFPSGLIAEIEDEARRLERSLSWVVQQCVKRGGMASVRSLTSDSAIDDPADAAEAAE